MKTVINLFVTVALFSSCSSTKQTSSVYDDDVYYSGKNNSVSASEKPQNNQYSNHEQDNATSQQEQPAQNADQQSSQNANQESSNQENSNNNNVAGNNNSSFNYDDYYDYEYATRMRRFYNPVPSYGYYDNYYTNSYWYSGNPAQWGLSVYMGYPWWGPSYYSYNYFPQSYWGCGWGLGFGWGYPYYGGGYWGYHHGFWGGGWEGHRGYYGMANNNYYNSHDNSGNYYGPRGNIGSTHSNGRAITPFGVKYERASAENGALNHVSTTSPTNSTREIPNRNNFSNQNIPRTVNASTQGGKNASNANNLPISKGNTGPRNYNLHNNNNNISPRSNGSGVLPQNNNNIPSRSQPNRSYNAPRSNSGGGSRSGSGGGGSHGSGGGSSHGGGGGGRHR